MMNCCRCAGLFLIFSEVPIMIKDNHSLLLSPCPVLGMVLSNTPIVFDLILQMTLQRTCYYPHFPDERI